MTTFTATLQPLSVGHRVAIGPSSTTPTPTPKPVVVAPPPPDGYTPKPKSFVDGVANTPAAAGVTKKPGFFRRLVDRLVAPAVTLMVAGRLRDYGLGFFASFKAARALRVALEQKKAHNPAALGTAYAQTLTRLLQDPTTDAFFGKLEAALASGAPVDVWMTAVKHYRSERAALSALAVLFQDKNPLSDSIQNVLTDPNLKALQPQALRLGKLSAALADPGIARTLLPPQARTTPVTNPAHFLVMAEAAARLRDAGISQKTAAIAPYALNTSYEYFQTRYATKTQPDGIAALAAKPWRAFTQVFFPRDPKAFDGTNATGLSDVYLGYAGASYGAGLTAPVSYEAFKTTFSVAPQAFAKSAFA